MSLCLEDYPDYEVEDEQGCLVALADVWAVASIWPSDPWHAWVVEAVIRPAVRKAFQGVTVH